MAAASTSAEPGVRSAPASRRMFVMAASPLARAIWKRPGPGGGTDGAPARSSVAAGQLRRPAAFLKSLLVLTVLTSGSVRGDEPGPRQAYQGEAAGRVAERGEGTGFLIP